jgi:hypothetical protein
MPRVTNNHMQYNCQRLNEEMEHTVRVPVQFSLSNSVLSLVSKNSNKCRRVNWPVCDLGNNLPQLFNYAHTSPRMKKSKGHCTSQHWHESGYESNMTDGGNNKNTQFNNTSHPSAVPKVTVGWAQFATPNGRESRFAPTQHTTVAQRYKSVYKRINQGWPDLLNVGGRGGGESHSTTTEE